MSAATVHIPVAIAVDPSGLLELISDLTTEEERAHLAAYVEANAGRDVLLVHLIPPAAMEQALTREQLQADGWFPEISDAYALPAGRRDPPRLFRRLAIQPGSQPRPEG